MDLGLHGQVALITGSGSGIGQAIALALAREGAAVLVNDLDAAACKETLELLCQAGAEGQGLAFDVADASQAQAAIAAAGRIDILVNNAAMMVDNLAFVEKQFADCEREIRVSLFGTLNCTHAVLAGMIERRHGRIVNIVSDAARVGQEKEVAYSAGKGGVMSFTKSLAREVGQHGITANAVSPAATDTPLRRALLKRLEEKMGAEGVASREEKVRRAYPMRRIGQPEDTGALVAFLASRQASHITGQICSVNGGFSMPG